MEDLIEILAQSPGLEFGAQQTSQLSLWLLCRPDHILIYHLCHMGPLRQGTLRENHNPGSHSSGFRTMSRLLHLPGSTFVEQAWSSICVNLRNIYEWGRSISLAPGRPSSPKLMRIPYNRHSASSSWWISNLRTHCHDLHWTPQRPGLVVDAANRDHSWYQRRCRANPLAFQHLLGANRAILSLLFQQ